MDFDSPLPPISSGRLGIFLIALAPVLYVFMPRPPIGGVQFLAFPAMAAILAVVVLLYLEARHTLPMRMLGILLLLLLLSAAVTLSFLFNVSDLRGTALAELFRPAVLIVFLLFGYNSALFHGTRATTRGLLLAAQIILVGQALIAVTQLAGIPLFDLLYSSEKARPIGSLVRVTGSMSNPNLFGWAVAQASVIAFFCGSRFRGLWLLLGILLILASGSRTLLLLFPFMIALPGMWLRGGGLMSYARGMVLGGAALAAIMFLVFSFAQYLPYLSQLRSVLLSGSLASVSSFASRINMWAAAYAEFASGGTLTWLFGLGSRASTRVLDNDFLYVLFRLGIVGLVLHTSIILYIVRCLKGTRENVASLIGLQYLVFALVLGSVYETLGGWNFPLLLFFLLGLSLGVSARATEASIAVNPRPDHPWPSRA